MKKKALIIILAAMLTGCGNNAALNDNPGSQADKSSKSNGKTMQENKDANVNGNPKTEVTKSDLAKLKDQAREMSLTTNVRLGMAVAEQMLEDYDVSTDGVKKLEQDLAEKLKGIGTNPVTRSDKVMAGPLNDQTRSQAAYAYNIDQNEINDSNYDKQPAPDINYAGVVKFDAYTKKAADKDILCVKFTPIGINGLPILSEVKTIY